jgi:alkanesulfonate monooxygenase SsuD/methylene tetrahydromethanopterin reductase-like flavin-dependent oxidoreductase (luciferase family)
MKVGSLVSPVGRRHPGLFAKITSTAAAIAPGRVIVGMGAGNAPRQQASLHQPFLEPARRVEMLREELTILRGLWMDPRTTFAGTHYEVTDAINEPKPSPLPEVLLGVKGAHHMPRLAAEFADRVNLLGNDDRRAEQVISAVSDHGRRIGRDTSSIVFGRLATVVFADDDEPLLDVYARLARELGYPVEEIEEEHRDWVLSVVGSPARCVGTITRRTVDLGIEELVVCMDTFATIDYERTMHGLRAFAEQVLPRLREAHR